MAYFDGGLHGWNDGAGYHSPATTTRVLCDDCAETEIPLTGAPGDLGRHWESGFRWASRYGGKTACSCCGKKDI